MPVRSVFAVAVAATMLLIPRITAAQHDMHHMPAHHGSHARTPISVMVGHAHGKGDVMVSYSFMRMHMADNIDGTSAVSTSDIVDPSGLNFMVAPLDMDMAMHMLGAMYGLTDDLTLMAMFPYLESDMNHQHRNGSSFAASSSGIGDVRLAVQHSSRRIGFDTFVMSIEVSIPTGSVTESNDAGSRLPYPMQIGSGSIGLTPALAYLETAGPWNWGTLLQATAHLNDNDEGYRLGKSAELTSWLLRRVNGWLSASGRIDARTWGNIDGDDGSLNPMMAPTARADLRAGTRISVLGGLDVAMPGGAFEGLRLGVEAGVPVYQNLDGPQLETDWTVTAGMQYVF